MNRDLEDKLQITQRKSLETAEKTQSIFHTIGALYLAITIVIVIIRYMNASSVETDINDSDVISNIVLILSGAIVCLIFYVMGNYLYYNLAVKAYTLEFLYNNSCCITDMNTNVIRLNNNMIDGINTICYGQNRYSANKEGDKYGR